MMVFNHTCSHVVCPFCCCPCCKYYCQLSVLLSSYF